MLIPNSSPKEGVINKATEPETPVDRLSTVSLLVAYPSIYFTQVLTVSET